MQSKTEIVSTPVVPSKPTLDEDNFLKFSAPAAFETAMQIEQPEVIRRLLKREKRKTVVKALQDRLEQLTGVRE